MQYDSISLKRSHRISHFTQVQGLTEDILREHNPHIRSEVWQRTRLLPAGVELHLPQGQGEVVAAALERAPSATTALLVADNGSMGYRVQNGDTLGVIANRVGSSVSTLQVANNLSESRSQIYPGQFLLVSEDFRKTPSIPDPPRRYVELRLPVNSAPLLGGCSA